MMYFYLLNQKKWGKDQTIGQPRDWPKPHGRDLCSKTMPIFWLLNLEHTLIYQKNVFMKKCYFSSNEATIWCGGCWKILKSYLINRYYYTFDGPDCMSANLSCWFRNVSLSMSLQKSDLQFRLFWPSKNFFYLNWS